VTVENGGQPWVGAPVMYANVNGEHLGTVMSDDAGKAVFVDYPSGGFVTAAVFPDIEGDAFDLRTVGGVQYGDEIVISISSRRLGDLAIQGFNAPPGTASYSYGVPTFAQTTEVLDAPLKIALSDQTLEPDGTLAATAIARDAEGKILGLATLEGIAVEGTPPDAIVTGAFSSWNEDPGFIDVVLRNDSATEISAIVASFAYRQGRKYQRGATEIADVAMADTLASPIPVDVGFNDKVIGSLSMVAGDKPVAVSSYAASRSDSLGDGEMSSLRASSDDILPLLLNTTRDITTRKASYGWDETPICAAGTPNISYMYFLGSSDDLKGFYSWSIVTPFADTVSMPQLDPNFAEALFPQGLIERQWELQALTYPEADMRSIRGAFRGYLEPHDWLAQRESDGEVCATRAHFD